MSKIFTFTYWELASMDVEVEAENEEEARRKLEEMKDNGDIRFDRLTTDDSAFVLMPYQDPGNGEKPYAVTVKAKATGEYRIYAKDADDAVDTMIMRFRGQKGDFDFSGMMNFSGDPLSVEAVNPNDACDRVCFSVD